MIEARRSLVDRRRLLGSEIRIRRATSPGTLGINAARRCKSELNDRNMNTV